MMQAELIVIDSETGGLDPDRDSLLSISLVAWSRHAISEGIELLIGEQVIETKAESMAINRLDLGKIRSEGIEPSDAVERLEHFVRTFVPASERAVLAGHNVSFDIGFLKRLYRLAGRDYSRVFSHRSFDTASVLRFLRLSQLADLPDDSSDAAFAYFKVLPPAELRHSALGDAMATAMLITRLVELGVAVAPHKYAVRERLAKNP